MFVTGDSFSPAMTAGEERMETPEDVAVMLRPQWLYLDHNQLSGPIPPELGNLANLNGLYLERVG